MLPVSAELVIGFGRSSTEIGGNLWARQVPVWWEQKGSAEWTGVLEVSNVCCLPCSVPAEDVSASSSCRQRHTSNRWWRVWNRFVLFHLAGLCVQGPLCAGPHTLTNLFQQHKVEAKNKNGRLKSLNLFIEFPSKSFFSLSYSLIFFS